MANRCRRRRCSARCSLACAVTVLWASCRHMSHPNTAWASGASRSRRGALATTLVATVGSATPCQANGLPKDADKYNIMAGEVKRFCLAPYEPANCALEADFPREWRRAPLSTGGLPVIWQARARKNDITIARWRLDPTGEDDLFLDMFYKLATPERVEEQLSQWESEFAPESRLAAPNRSGSFNVTAGSTALLDVAGRWKAAESSKTFDGYAMRGIITPAAERDLPYAFYLKAVGPQAKLEKRIPELDTFVASFKLG
eukprot:TRINITY_DN77102_c0_g1_i1.p1 TRINITY_DN77102_c0_g1~~TRINITY_DN77102_c0_g1_i1.p1  ORF type:complete len:258 (+),score=33.58 TRINITY_DN77102_c0_g1_i1:29-802(+)